MSSCGGPVARPIGAPPPPPRVVAGALDANALLDEPSGRAVKHGASALSVVASGAVVEGERSGAFVELAPDSCLLAYARGSATVEDVDVVVISDEGAALAVDERPDPRPTLILCPPHPPRVFVTLHVVAGEGLVALGAHAVPRERAAEVAQSLGARGPLTDANARRAEAWPGLDERVRAHRAAIGGKWEEVRKVAVPLDARAPTVAPLPIEQDHCLDVLVVPDDDVIAPLDVEARDGDGRVLARAKEGGRERTLTLCAPFAVTGTLVIRPRIGAGVAAVILGRARADVAKELATGVEALWAASTAPLEQARASRATALGKAGYAAPTASVTGNASVGRRAMVPLDLPGPCARLDVVGGAPVALVEARAWDDAGALAGSGDGAQGAALFVCGKKRVNVEVEAKGRPGPFAIDARKEPWDSPAFASAPLAASRMLGRYVDAPPFVMRGSAGAARAVTVDAARRAIWDETIPAGQCALFSVGVEGEGAGVDLRIVDPPTNDELDRSHGDASALATACAQGTPRRVRVELSAAAGKLTAIAGTRFR